MTLTISPTIVISTCAPSPTAPNQARPVWTPAPIGTHGPSGSAWPVAVSRSWADSSGVFGVPFRAEHRRVHGHQLVAHELFHHAVVREDRARGGRIEAVEQRSKLGWRHLLGQFGRAPDIGEQHGDFNLGTAAVLHEGLLAGVAEVRVLRRLSLADEPHGNSAATRERRRAQAASGLGRHAIEEVSAGRHHRIGVGEVVAPEFLVPFRGGHGSIVCRPSTSGASLIATSHSSGILRRQPS